MVRFCTLMVGRSALRNILENRKQFWKINSFDNTIENRMKSIICMSLIFFKMFITFVCILTALFICLPAVEGKHRLPLSTWLPKGYPGLFEITYAIQTHVSVMCALFVIGFDILFAAICIELTIQFQLLNSRLLSLASFKVEHVTQKVERLERLKNCVQYHSFLIR